MPTLLSMLCAHFLPVYSKQGQSVCLACGNHACRRNTVLVKMLKAPSPSPRHCHRRLCCAVNAGRSARPNSGPPLTPFCPPLLLTRKPYLSPGLCPLQPQVRLLFLAVTRSGCCTYWAASPAPNQLFPLLYFHHLSGDF